MNSTLTTVGMTPKQWAAVRDNPIQRDTERHAAKAERAHLKDFAAPQSRVAAAKLPNGTLIKLDGHTRSLLWSTGKLRAPAELQVDIYDVPDEEAAERLYWCFDAPGAAESADDRIAGAYRRAGFSPVSSVLMRGGVTSALRLIDPRTNVYDLVGMWLPELQAVDALDAAPNTMPAVLLCAALLTLRIHGAQAADFWRLVIASGGSRIDGQSCGVDALVRLMSDLRARKRLGGNTAMRIDQAGKAISCCEAWLAGRRYSVGVKSTDLADYTLRCTTMSTKTKGRKS